MLEGDRLSLARVISFIEDRGEHLRKLIDEIYPKTGHAFVLGITGPPGAGKSTVTDKLVREIRDTGKRVAVIAVDPSSPFSGGAILGDRIRMQQHSGDQGVYIRSLGTRGKHGGLSQSSKEVVMALDAAGYDFVVVETAGVGQTELDILKLAHAVCVVLVPESGDSIQVMKAGLMEIADLFVVNKCDRPEADKLVKELVNMIGMNDVGSASPGELAHHGTVTQQIVSHPPVDSQFNAYWNIPVIKTQALFNLGIDDLFKNVLAYREFAVAHGTLEKKRAQFLQEEILEIVWARTAQSVRQKLASQEGQKLLAAVLEKKSTPYEAADRIGQNFP